MEYLRDLKKSGVVLGQKSNGLGLFLVLLYPGWSKSSEYGKKPFFLGKFRDDDMGYPPLGASINRPNLIDDWKDLCFI